jgi:DNA mismatch repair protein MutS2
MAAFREGDAVRVRALAKNGVVAEVLSGNRYRISLGSLLMVCRESELVATTAKKDSQLATRPNYVTASHCSAPSSIDLHGLSVADALRAVESFLDRAVLVGLAEVSIIHGLGSGKVQRAVHEYLHGIPSVSDFKLSDSNPGETRVFL